MKENNNKGFTLIEILVAIVALALVVVPLLQGFVATANLNKKSRERMMATNVAQTHMEEYSGYTIEEIDKIRNKSLYDANPTHAFTEAPNHKYSYPIKNYNHNGKTYDIRLSIDASPYGTTVDDAGNTIVGINDTGFAEVTSIDVTQDGIWAESENVLNDALREFKKRNTEATSSTVTNRNVPWDEFKTRLNRNINIILSQGTDLAGTTYTEVKLQYQYYYTGTEIWLDDDDKEYEKSIIIYSNQNESPRKELRNVYLLFRPYYDKMFYDSITIENYNNLDINVYLVKLNNHDTDLLNLENNYQSTVRVRENTSGEDFNAADFRAHTKIFTNLRYNLAIEDENDPQRNVESQTTYLYFVSPSPLATPQFNKIEYDYFIPEYKEERMYRMKVEVYNAGAADNSFPDSEKLAELSN